MDIIIYIKWPIKLDILTYPAHNANTVKKVSFIMTHIIVQIYFKTSMQISMATIKWCTQIIQMAHNTVYYKPGLNTNHGSERVSFSLYFTFPNIMEVHF